MREIKSSYRIFWMIHDRTLVLKAAGKLEEQIQKFGMNRHHYSS